MTGQEILDFTTTILDGLELDDDTFYPLLNIAKTNVEEIKVWRYLIKLNTPTAVSTGSSVALPSDFAEDYKVLVGTRREFFPVRYEDQHQYEDVSFRYYIDLSNETINFLGNFASDTLYFYYKRFTPEIAAGTEPVFPERFHRLLAFYVAGYYQNGVDADDVFARMAPENKIAAQTLLRSMQNWDTRLSARAQNNQVGVVNSVSDVAVSDM